MSFIGASTTATNGSALRCLSTWRTMADCEGSKKSLRATRKAISICSVFGCVSDRIVIKYVHVFETSQLGSNPVAEHGANQGGSHCNSFRRRVLDDEVEGKRENIQTDHESRGKHTSIPPHMKATGFPDPQGCLSFCFGLDFENCVGLLHETVGCVGFSFIGSPRGLTYGEGCRAGIHIYHCGLLLVTEKS